MVDVGIIGIGGMGRMHFNCYRANLRARVAAICDVDHDKLAGDWSRIGLNLDSTKTAMVDLSGVRTYSDWREMLADDTLQVIDICLPTPFHAEVSMAVLEAGKDLLCEKPMALTLDECLAMEKAQAKSGKRLLIGHCLRYWPEYVKSDEIIRSGEYGKVLRASFYRAGATPEWSWDNWLLDGARSGGAVLDMHIHDVDTALWWFGKPDAVHATGLVDNGLPLSVDAVWTYATGPVVTLHGSWDRNGGDFRYGFQVVMERGTLYHDSVSGTLKLFSNSSSEILPIAEGLAYQFEIDDMIDAIANDRPITRVTPQASRLAVETTLEELRLLY